MAMDRLQSHKQHYRYKLLYATNTIRPAATQYFFFLCFLLVLASHACSCHPCFFFFFYYDRLLIPEIRFLIADCACLFALQPGACKTTRPIYPEIQPDFSSFICASCRMAGKHTHPRSRSVSLCARQIPIKSFTIFTSYN